MNRRDFVTGMTAAGVTVGFPARAATGEKSELWRPQVHFSPARNWMNDPNGLVWFDGLYHMFYQYNPKSRGWGHMSWGHAVSRDLLHWRELPVAIAEGSDGMIFSGSVVVDPANTSGLGVDGRVPLVAIYTRSANVQSQCLAYSTDSGMTWTKYAGNPVLDLGMRDFRDPKVIWFAPGQHWVMVVSRAAERRLAFYRSDNLKDWTETSRFGPSGNVAGAWECPDLFELPVINQPGRTHWVLKVDSGDGGQAFVGDFDGETFVADDQGAQRLDLGQDDYASASFSNLPRAQQRHVSIGWMNNWRYAPSDPTTPWQGAMTLPREVGLVATGEGMRLVQRPVRELGSLRGVRRDLAPFRLDGQTPLTTVERDGPARHVVLTIDAGQGGGFRLLFRSQDRTDLTIAADLGAGTLTIDRGPVASLPRFDARTTAPMIRTSDLIRIELVLDRGSVEVFICDGLNMISERLLPSDGAYSVFLAGDDTVECMGGTVWNLTPV